MSEARELLSSFLEDDLGIHIELGYDAKYVLEIVTMLGLHNSICIL